MAQASIIEKLADVIDSKARVLTVGLEMVQQLPDFQKALDEYVFGTAVASIEDADQQLYESIEWQRRYRNLVDFNTDYSSSLILIEKLVTSV